MRNEPTALEAPIARFACSANQHAPEPLQALCVAAIHLKHRQEQGSLQRYTLRKQFERPGNIFSFLIHSIDAAF